MKSPFFSVVIPTKNRCELAAQAVRSVLRQSFPTFEIIVADNDDTSATRDAIDRFSDPRIRYLRTGGLSMADNWEAGCIEAHGEYICILEDKQVYKRGTLERVYRAAELDRPPCIRWQSESFEPCGCFRRVRHSRSIGGTRQISADEVFGAFTDKSYSTSKRLLPLGHMGCHHRKIASAIRTGPLGRCCSPAEPDYTLAFALLAYADSILLLDEGLVLFADTSCSNGLQFRMKTENARRFVRNSGGQTVFCDRVPINALTIPGAIANDYLRVQDAVGGRLAGYPLNWTNYFVESFLAIQESRELGVDVAADEAEWHRAFQEQTEDVRCAVMDCLQMNPRGPTTGLRKRWKRFLRSTGLRDLQQVLKGVVRALVLRDPNYRFRTIDEYLDWEHAERKRQDTETDDLSSNSPVSNGGVTSGEGI